jgi:hypothetical protein
VIFTIFIQGVKKIIKRSLYSRSKEDNTEKAEKEQKCV